MKKIFTLATLAILALVSCSKAAIEPKLPENDEPMEISFKAYNFLNQTKATAGTTKYTGSDFGAFAYFTPGDWGEGDLSDVYMNNARITYSQSAKEWMPATKYYWPKDGKLNFVCYAPHTANSVMKYTLDKGVTFPSYTANGSTDLMWSDIAINQTMNKKEYHLTDNTEGVPTLFHHALTKVAFEFALDDIKPAEVKSVAITLYEASIVNIKNNGTFNEKGANNKPTWSSQTGSVVYPIFSGEKKLATTATSENCKNYIVLPQELVKESQMLKLSYDIEITFASNDKESTFIHMIDEMVDLKCEKVQAWNVNKSILYTIKISAFSKNPIYFDPAEVNWDAQDAAEIDIK